MSSWECHYYRRAQIVTTVVGGVLSFKATSDAADPKLREPEGR